MYTGRIYPSGAFSVGRKRPSKSQGLGDYFRGGSYEEWVKKKHDALMRMVARGRIEKGHVPGPIKYKPSPGGDPPLLWKEGIDRVKSQAERPHGVGLTFDSINANYNSRWGGFPVPPRKSPLSLDLTTLSYCRAGKKRRGLNGLTKVGKRSIREGGYLLTKFYGRTNLAFYTCTCPYSDADMVHVFSKNINIIIKRYFERLRRAYARLGEEFDYVCGIEIQPTRMHRCDIVAMHIHYICNAKSIGASRKWLMTFEELRAIWHDVVYNACGFEINSKVSVDGSGVEHDASSYLMKYMSKGKDDIEKAEELVPGVVPGRWYSLNNRLRKLIKAETVVMTSGRGADFWHFCRTNQGDDSLFYKNEMVVLEGYGDKGHFVVGYYGCFNNNCKEALTEYWRTS